MHEQKADADVNFDGQGVENVTAQATNVLRGFRALPDERHLRALQYPAQARRDDLSEPESLIERFLIENLRPGQSLGGKDIV